MSSNREKSVEVHGVNALMSLVALVSSITFILKNITTNGFNANM